MTLTPPLPSARPDREVPPPPAPVVRIRGLTKAFPVRRTWADLLRGRGRGDRVNALQGVSLDVRRGEFFGLLGQNGAGKTTLFKILATLITPDAGTAEVAGHDIRSAAGRVRHVLTPVIANERSLNWRLTAWENLRLYADLHGLEPARRRRRIADVLDIVQLSEAGSKIAGAFSSGMKQRLLIARALLAEPEVLLLDEPTRSLDPISAREFRRFLREEIGGRLGCTILLATHNAEEVFHLCDRVGVLHHGRMLTVAGTDALVHRVGEDRYVVWTTDAPSAVKIAVAECDPVPTVAALLEDVDGWQRVELQFSGGPEAAAATLTALHRHGIRVARFERVPVSLADVIDRVVLSAGQAP